MSVALQLGIIYCAISIFCGLILLFFARTLSQNTPRYDITRYVVIAYIFAGISSFAECFYGLTELEQIPFIEPLAYIGMTICIVFTILCGLSWTLYSEKKQKSWISRTQTRTALFLLPAAIVLILIIISPFTHFFFYFEDGHYQRGTLFLPLILVVFAYCIYTGINALICSMKKEHYIDRRSYIKLAIYAFSISIIQILQFAIEIMFPIRSFGTMVIFGILLIRTMDELIGVDALTHLSNRYAMEHHLSELMESDEKFGITILDIDKFKSINDTFGHAEGDTAIKYVSKAILEAVPRDYSVFRIGGDEFIIIGGETEADLAGIEADINTWIEKLLSEHQFRYRLTVSAGSYIKDDAVNSIPDLIEVIDKKMYRQKASKR